MIHIGYQKGKGIWYLPCIGRNSSLYGAILEKRNYLWLRMIARSCFLADMHLVCLSLRSGRYKYSRTYSGAYRITMNRTSNWRHGTVVNQRWKLERGESCDTSSYLGKGKGLAWGHYNDVWWRNGEKRRDISGPKRIYLPNRIWWSV